MKIKMLVGIALVSLFLSSAAYSWCIVDFGLDEEACGFQSVYVSTDIVFKNMAVSFCISKEQAIEFINFFKARNVEEIIGKCHRESLKKGKKPEVIHKIDECIIQLSPK